MHAIHISRLSQVFRQESFYKSVYIFTGRGYFLSDKSDKNISLGIVPKTLKKSKSFNLIFTGIQKDFRLIGGLE